MSITYAEKDDIKRCVDLHLRSLKDGLFSKLGAQVLTAVYRFALNDKNTIFTILCKFTRKY